MCLATYIDPSPGKLDREQLCQAMQDLRLPNAKANMEAFMHILDVDGNGSVSKDKFTKYCFTIRMQRRFRNRRRAVSCSTTSKRFAKTFVPLTACHYLSIVGSVGECRIVERFVLISCCAGFIAEIILSGFFLKFLSCEELFDC